MDEILAIDPNANVIVLGDMNDFQFSYPISDVLAADVLTNLMNTLPITEQYTFIFNGNSQALDHILVSGNLFRNLVDFDVVHVNAEFAYHHSPERPSNHDPVLATFYLETRVIPVGGVTTPTVPSKFWFIPLALGGLIIGFLARKRRGV